VNDEVDAETVRQEAAVQMHMAELVDGGMMTAHRVPGGPITFRLTDKGKQYVESMPIKDGDLN
jgi:hypothetical protein